MRQILARAILAGAIAASTVSGTALGHECFIVSRSDTGDLAAGGNSRVWATLGSLGDLFRFVGEALGLAPLSDQQLAWAVDAAEAAGLPSQLTIFIGSHTIAEGTPAMVMHASDAHGVDHIYDWGPVLIGIYLDALSH
jgi:hypothetical protein